VVEAVRIVFITVIGPQVEVRDDLHLLGQEFEHILLKQDIADGSDGVEVELCAEVVEYIVAGGSIFAVLTERGDGGPVGARADEDLEDVLWADFSVLAEAQAERPGEGVDEKVKELVFVDFIVCLLFRCHTISKQTSQLTGFVKY
jgi:hypothetical protein